MLSLRTSFALLACALALAQCAPTQNNQGSNNNVARESLKMIQKLSQGAQNMIESVRYLREITENTDISNLSKKEQLIRGKLIEAEKRLKSSEEKLNTISTKVTSDIDYFLEHVEARIQKREAVNKKTLDILRLRAKNNPQCDLEYSPKIDSFLEDASNRLQDCAHDDIKILENVYCNAKEIATDLPKKVADMSSRIVNCISNPTKECIDPLNDVLELVAQIRLYEDEVAFLFDSIDLSSISIDLSTCLRNSDQEVRDDLSFLKQALNECLAGY